MLPLIAAALLSAGDAGTSVVKVKAATLIQAYADNELGAEAKYKGKTVEVSGPVLGVGKNKVGTVFVGLYSVSQPAYVVNCLLLEKDPRAGELKTGQQIKVTGVVGEADRTGGEMVLIQLLDCRL
jgi:hypothetical protein